MTSENGVDISTSISTRLSTKRKYRKQYLVFVRHLVIIEERRVGVKNRVKHAILRVRILMLMSLVFSLAIMGYYAYAYTYVLVKTSLKNWSSLFMTSNQEYGNLAQSRRENLYSIIRDFLENSS